MKNSSSLIVTLFLCISHFAFSQQQNENSWSVGLGASNFIMHGDLTSANSAEPNLFNIGFYAYIDKMITPVFGFEAKTQFSNMKGSAQDFPGDTDNLRFEGTAFGAEFNTIINLSNIGQKVVASKKINFTSYFGIGFHTYNSKQYNLDTDELLIDFGDVSFRSGNAKSIYFTTALGMNLRLTDKINLELRQSINFNNEDHLDATVSDKQQIESFFITQIGVNFKLNAKNKTLVTESNLDENITTIIEEKEPVKSQEKIELIDSDGDGVMDKFDKEPNTPEGVLVYGNGIAIDSDKDGFPDYKDDCPFVASKNNNGCLKETIIDTDGDGIADVKDKCIHRKGNILNHGCPGLNDQDYSKLTTLAKGIFFKSGSFELTDPSLNGLDKIAVIMMKYPKTEFIIEGHTDSGEKSSSSYKLSQERANSVKKYMIFAGVDENNLDAIGFGYSKPKYDKGSVIEKKYNRRVEIKLKIKVKVGDKHAILYRIGSKETLNSIASKFGVTVADLKIWNNLKSDTIIKGDTLTIKTN
jgi:outer membrane protein OmpA-like peptidoglycan-associated protein